MSLCFDNQLSIYNKDDYNCNVNPMACKYEDFNLLGNHALFALDNSAIGMGWCFLITIFCNFTLDKRNHYNSSKSHAHPSPVYASQVCGVEPESILEPIT